MEWLSPKFETYCALFDKSTKIGTHVEQYLENIFGYGGAHENTRDGRGSDAQNGYHAIGISSPNYGQPTS